MGFLIQLGLGALGLWVCIALPFWIVGVAREVWKANQ